MPGSMSYMDFGSHYKLVGNNSRPADVQRKGEEIETYCPPEEFKLGQARERRQNHRFEDHEVFQWLFAIGKMSSRPEQIWVERGYHTGSSASYKGQRETISTFDLSAGSVAIRAVNNYGCEGHEFSSLQELVLLFQGLWRWRRVSLGQFEFYASQDTPFPRPWLSIVAKPIQAHAGLPASFGVLNQWLLNCTSNHPLCGRTEPLKLPSRPIGVGPPNGTKSPRLYVPRSWSTTQSSRYAIFSYC